MALLQLRAVASGWGERLLTPSEATKGRADAVEARKVVVQA